MCPYPRRLVNGEGGFLEAGEMVCHCLLVEGPRGLTLVDTGFGVEDLRAPRERLGAAFTAAIRPQREERTTALAQVRALGFDPADVRDLVVTHLDLDHAGGLPDFPHARVHTSYDEQRAAVHPPTLAERERYRRAHFAHGPKWALHASEGGERWFGFDAVRALEEGDPEVLLVPLAGHSRGHCAVAVRTEKGWLLHCGDAYFHRVETQGDGAGAPFGLRLFQRLVASNNALRVANQARLRELVREHASEVTVFCAHDPREFEALRGVPAATRARRRDAGA